ncbi:hypothetical protein LOTGIDRAFT_150554 [Lottia gigantea]|uniref:Vitelline envelope sperm lysin receptor C-terminal domain-containing protein n=1 Tax=Lottia gigantea TaxID=225164 RepID=V3ZZN5_LOTGI|nr:hypothetical protein LOTGIDRAFT_150554 [Lottia gigantea]ESO89842.1 hypothetical protein LOTGIDRAFT_150554 [Lottia gigantea]
MAVDCGSLSTGPATLRFVGNVHSLKGYGGGGDCSFNEDFEPGTFTLKVGYEASQGHSCLFKNIEMGSYEMKIDSHTYEFLEIDGDLKFVVVCSFSKFKDDVLREVPLKTAFLPPNLLVFQMGRRTTSTFAIFPSDIFDNVIRGKILEGRVVKLRTHMAASNVETGRGYIPLVCTVGNADSSVLVPILVDGCGTGFPWSSDEGFEMEGPSGMSPLFRMFRIMRDESATFRCSFIVCNGACDGNSCVIPENRRKRSLQHHNIHNATFQFEVETSAPLTTHPSASLKVL